MQIDIVSFMDEKFREALKGLHITIEDVAEENAYAYVMRRVREIQAAEDL